MLKILSGMTVFAMLTLLAGCPSTPLKEQDGAPVVDGTQSTPPVKPPVQNPLTVKETPIVPTVIAEPA